MCKLLLFCNAKVPHAQTKHEQQDLSVLKFDSGFLSDCGKSTHKEKQIMQGHTQEQLENDKFQSFSAFPDEGQGS